MKFHLRKRSLKKICLSPSPTLFIILGSMSKQVLRAPPSAWDTQYTISQVHAYDENYLLLVSSCYHFLLIEQVQYSWFKWKFNNDYKKISKQKAELNRVESQSGGLSYIQQSRTLWEGQRVLFFPDKDSANEKPSTLFTAAPINT